MNQPSRLATLYLLGFALDLVNIFIASVAYPDIGRSLGASVATLAWIGNTYLLGLTLVIPLSVWLASRLGERRLMLLALAGFASASLGCGLAGSAATLIVWRLCQGLAGGLLIPLGQAMAYRNVPSSARAGLTARVMLVALIVPAVAPALGGWLVDSLSWRGIFFASVAPALLVLALAMRWLPRHKHAAQRLDLRGLLLGSAALATLLVALAWLGSPGGGGRGLLLALLACVLGCCYWRDGRARTDALLDLGLLEAPLLRTAMLVYLCVPGAFMGANLVAMLYLQGPRPQREPCRCADAALGAGGRPGHRPDPATLQSLGAEILAAGGHGDTGRRPAVAGSKRGGERLLATGGGLRDHGIRRQPV